MQRKFKQRANNNNNKKYTTTNLSDEFSPLVSSKVILHIRAAKSRAVSDRWCLLSGLSASDCPLAPTSSVVKASVLLADLHKPVPPVTWTPQPHGPVSSSWRQRHAAAATVTAAITSVPRHSFCRKSGLGASQGNDILGQKTHIKNTLKQEATGSKG